METNKFWDIIDRMFCELDHCRTCLTNCLGRELCDCLHDSTTDICRHVEFTPYTDEQWDEAFKDEMDKFDDYQDDYDDQWDDYEPGPCDDCDDRKMPYAARSCSSCPYGAPEKPLTARQIEKITKDDDASYRYDMWGPDSI